MQILTDRATVTPWEATYSDTPGSRSPCYVRINVRHQLNAEKDVDICRICVMREMNVPTLLEKTIFKRLVRDWLRGRLGLTPAWLWLGQVYTSPIHLQR